MTGYHGTKKQNEENILKNGFKVSNSNNYHHWLGSGIYFWEDSYYAIEWNLIDLEKNGVVNQKNLLTQYTIFETIIKDEKNKTLRLSSPRGSILFEKFKKQVMSKANDKQRKRLKEINDDIFWINFMSQKGLFDKYDIIVADYYKIIKKDEEYKNDGNFIKYEQTQICIKSNDLIEKNSIYNNNKEIKELYNIIRHMRSKKRRKEVLI